MKRVVYLVTAVLVALVILAPTAFAQEMRVEQKREVTTPLPPSGGPAFGSMLPPAAALLVGSGVLAYAVLRRRQ